MATNVGTTSILGSSLSLDQNSKYFLKITATATGKLASISIYCSVDSGAGSATTRCGVYANSAGAPGALAGTSDARVDAAGSSWLWRTWTFSTQPSITTSTDYFIGIQTATGSYNVNIKYAGSGGVVYEIADTYSNGLLDPWGAGGGPVTRNYSMYGTIVPANTAPNAPTLTSPISGSTIDYLQSNAFTWTFSDPDSGDTQSAFQLRYKLTSAGSWTTLAYATSPYGTYSFVGSTFGDGEYEWQGRTKDALGLEGAWSSSSTFTAAATADAPVITDPVVDATITTATYPVVWSCPDQVQGYQCRVTADDGAGAPDTASVQEDTGLVAEADTRTVTMAFDTNNVTQHIQVRVKNGGSFGAWASVRIDVAYTPPDTPTLVLTADSTAGNITVDVTVPSGAGPDATTYDVYRALVSDGTGGFRIARGQVIATAAGVGTGSWVDESPKAGVLYYFKAIVYAATGTPASSAWT